jgi:hypothetical protein
MTTFFAPARLIFSPHDLWLWIACSVLLSALVNGLIWRCRRSSLAPRWAGVLGLLSWVGGGGRFLFFVGLPYLALLGGLIPANTVGLVPGHWARDLVLLLPLALGAMLVLLSLRLLVSWRERSAFGAALGAGSLLPLGVRLRESLYREARWAFLRSAPLLAVERRELGIALGLGIVALEAWLDPAWRSRWREFDGVLQVWQGAVVAVLMAVVFGVTGNWWVTLAIHLIVETAAGWLWPRVRGLSATTA